MKAILLFNLCLILLQAKAQYEIIQTISSEQKEISLSLAMTDDS